MSEMKQALAVITARGGSKGLPGKNIKPFCGKPLIAWTIEAAQQACCIERTILSSDDPEIIATAREYGCEVPFTRPAKLSGDTASSIDVLIHALDNVGKAYEWVVLLQPTSPLRTSEDIDNAFALCQTNNAPACISVSPPAHSPYLCCVVNKDLHFSNLLQHEMHTPRQMLPEIMQINGAVYIAKTEWIKKERSFITPQTIAYCMPGERSADIDDKFDFLMAEALKKHLLESAE